MRSRELAHWRQWAALITLASDLDGYAFTSVIANRTNSLGWRVWPENVREWTRACRRALERGERNHHVEAEKAIEDFIRYGKWPKPGTLPVCIRLPQMAVVPPRQRPNRGQSE